MSLSDKEIKELSPPDGNALVYILRPSSVGKFVKFKTFCNDQYIGAIKGKNYLYIILEPGLYKFMAKAENKDVVDLVVEPGKTYFLLQKAKMGAIKARVKIYLMEEDEARVKLQKCKLSKLLP